MTRFERKEAIYNYIKERRVCDVGELQKKFKISVSTLHRDLNQLEREGRIDKYYGKVSCKTEQNYFKSRIRINIELKKRIARKAIEFIENGDCIFLDNSTTVYYLAELLANSAYKNIMVVSNSAFLSGLFLENRDIDYICLGGKLNKDLNCFVGANTEKALKNFNGTKYFFSTSSISVQGGISDIYVPDENIIKVNMHRYSRKSFLLVDSTKFGKESTVKWFEISDVDYIITDSGINKVYIDQFRKLGINLIIA